MNELNTMQQQFYDVLLAVTNKRKEDLFTPYEQKMANILISYGALIKTSSPSVGYNYDLTPNGIYLFELLDTGDINNSAKWETNYDFVRWAFLSSDAIKKGRMDAELVLLDMVLGTIATDPNDRVRARELLERQGSAYIQSFLRLIRWYNKYLPVHDVRYSAPTKTGSRTNMNITLTPEEKQIFDLAWDDIKEMKGSREMKGRKTFAKDAVITFAMMWIRLRGL